MLIWKMLHPKMTLEHLGLLPGFLDENNPEPAVKQLDANYGHGGGWRPMESFKLSDDNVLQYPGDPPLKPLAETKLRDELIVYYDYAIVAVIQPDRSFEAARMD